MDRVSSNFETHHSLPRNLSSEAQEGKEKEVTFTEYVQWASPHRGTFNHLTGMGICIWQMKKPELRVGK